MLRILVVGVCALLAGCATEGETNRLTVHARAVEVDINGGTALSNVQAELEITTAQLVATSSRLAALESAMSGGTVRLSGLQGYGATATCIRRFQVVQEDAASDSITYLDDPAGGASLTIEESGVYAMSFTDLAPATYSFGFTRNATLLDQSIIAAPASSVLGYTTVNASGTAFATSVSATVRLVAGDVVRPHTTCDSAAPNGGGAIFVITQVSK